MHPKTASPCARRTWELSQWLKTRTEFGSTAAVYHTHGAPAAPTERVTNVPTALNPSNEQPEVGILKTVPFTSAPKH